MEPKSGKSYWESILPNFKVSKLALPSVLKRKANERHQTSDSLLVTRPNRLISFWHQSIHRQAREFSRTILLCFTLPLAPVALLGAPMESQGSPRSHCTACQQTHHGKHLNKLPSFFQQLDRARQAVSLEVSKCSMPSSLQSSFLALTSHRSSQGDLFAHDQIKKNR